MRRSEGLEGAKPGALSSLGVSYVAVECSEDRRPGGILDQRVVMHLWLVSGAGQRGAEARSTCASPDEDRA